MTTKKPIDWERIELDYRAGILTLREMATSGGVTEGAIRKRAKRDDWTRDLAGKIKAKADDLVRREEVRKEVRKDAILTERVLVDGAAKLIADVRIGHKTHVARAIRIVNKLFDDLEDLGDEQESILDMIRELNEADSEDGEESSRILELANRIGSLPMRTKTMKDLSDTLKTLITLERDAYDIVTATKVEMTGANGGAIQHTEVSTETLKEELAALGFGRESNQLSRKQHDAN